ncbi:MAG: aldose 1-epimerase, partial [Chloroflexi bacterium]|nr:aldose 1-epimerase [Chloroflexota bacterium]
AAGAEAVLDPGAGGRLAALRVDGLVLLVTRGQGPLTWGCYPMAPWAGRTRDGVLRWHGEDHQLPTDLLPPHAIHGTLLEAAWEVISTGPAAATLAADLGPPWPFGGRVVQQLRLEPGALQAELEVQAGRRPMPAIVGWHPWFPRVLRGSSGEPVGRPVELDLPAGGMLRRGADGIPTGEVVRPIPAGPWDDCFVELVASPVVRWPGALEIMIRSDARFWVVFTEREEGICVEPQTGPPNGLNTGAHAVVEPGRPLVASMTMAWRHLAAS